MEYNTDQEPLQIRLIPYDNITVTDAYALDKNIFDLDSKIDLLSSHADKLDYFVSISSGVLCGILDILWVGNFDLQRGTSIATDKINSFVIQVAKMCGCKKDDLSSAVKYLEKYHIPSDGNTAIFGGGKQHHLRDFAHHPTIVGLIFSLLTQFTGKTFGTDVNGKFIIVDVPESKKQLIGKDIPTKILYGTLIWFFHLVSDIAGSSSTAGKSVGTGLPGPILSLAKELSVLPFFKNIKIRNIPLSEFISKLFNGTLFIKRDANNKIIKETVTKIDFRAEFGIAIELARMSVPVVANECIVRVFYFIRRLGIEMREKNVKSLSDFQKIEWNDVKPSGNPTIARMLTIATGIFTTIDVGEAAVTKQWISVNLIGVGRFAVALGDDVNWCLQARQVKKIKQMYEDIKRNSYSKSHNDIYNRISDGLEVDKLGLTVEQAEILYNLEYFKTLNDIKKTTISFIDIKILRYVKQEWLNEWKSYISKGFPAFMQKSDAVLHWYKDENELIQKISMNQPSRTWFRLVLLEAMLFEPYFPLSLEKDKKGNDIPSQKYDVIKYMKGYKRSDGDKYLHSLFCNQYYYKNNYINRLRKCYDKVLRELNEVLKTALTSLAITSVVTIAAVATAGILAPSIAVFLVGSNFAGLSGAALTNACLAFLGGGAIAAGGLGMAGGTAVIVGGGAILGLGAGAGIGGAVGTAMLVNKKTVILQSAKLLVAIREIFLNDEKDIEFSNSVYEKYVQNIAELEKNLVELKLKEDDANGEEKKKLKTKIKDLEESVDAMKIARKSFLKFKSSFEEGMEC